MREQACHKQRLKDLNERLGIEQLKLSRISENASTLQQLKSDMCGEEIIAWRHWQKS